MPIRIPKIANDFNRELIEVYKTIRDRPDELIEELRKHRNEKEHFLEVRAWDRQDNFTLRSDVERAARFIYLNKTCFNGLYRVNAKGYFNVPFGQQTNPDLIQSDNFRNVSRFLNGPLHQGSQAKVSLVSGDYRKATLLAERKDFVYFDPPYDPISSTSSFVSYHNSGFGKADQIELRDEIIRLSEMKIPILLSNSDTPFIRSLYNDGKIFEIERVTVQRAIGATAASRIVVGELLINNYKAVGVDLTDDRK